MLCTQVTLKRVGVGVKPLIHYHFGQLIHNKSLNALSTFSSFGNQIYKGLVQENPIMGINVPTMIPIL
jgi:hypothetical protein